MNSKRITAALLSILFTANTLAFSAYAENSENLVDNEYSSVQTVNNDSPETFLATYAKPSVTSVTPYENRLVIRWSSVSGAKYYRVFYRISGTSKWSYKTTTYSSMNLTGLTSGKKYDLLVRSYNGKVWTSFTSEDIVTAVTKAQIIKPVISSAVPGANSVSLKWGAVSGATSYRVYYRVNGTTKWSYKNTTAAAMNLTGLVGGKKYDLLVRAFNGSQWSPFTSADIITATPKAVVPSKPSVTSVTAEKNSVTLKWNAVSGAKSYRVYYRISGISAKWTFKDVNDTSYTFTGLTGGKKYDFIVRAYNGSAWSPFTSADIVTATPYSAPSAPALPTVKLTSGDSKVTLTWNAVENATEYSVLYRLNGTSKWTEKTTVSTAYTVSGLNNGQTYDFLVLAYNDNVCSAWTNADIMTAAPVGYSISGTVFVDQLQGKENLPNKKLDDDDSRLNGIKVQLSDKDGNVLYTTETADVNNESGKYIFNDLTAGQYNISFFYFGCEYISEVMLDENQQSIDYSDVPNGLDEFTVKADGTYVDGKKISDIVSITDARSADIFTSSAKSTLSLDSDMVLNFGLLYRSYADLALYCYVKSATINDTTDIIANTRELFSVDAEQNDKITLKYKLTVTNQSSVINHNTKAVIYIPAKLCSNVRLSNGYPAVFTKAVYINEIEYYGYVIDVDSLINGGYFYENIYFDFTFTEEAIIRLYAEITEYSFEGGLYDKESIPGNLLTSIENGKFEDDESRGSMNIY